MVVREPRRKERVEVDSLKRGRLDGVDVEDVEDAVVPAAGAGVADTDRRRQPVEVDFVARTHIDYDPKSAPGPPPAP